MREVDLTGLQVSGDEKRRLHAAIGRARQRTRLWQNVGVGARPAGEPGRIAFRRNVGAESAGSESLLAQRLVQPGLPDAERKHAFTVYTVPSRRVADSLYPCVCRLSSAVANFARDRPAPWRTAPARGSSPA